MNYLDEIKKVSLNIFFALGVITLFLNIYKRVDPYFFIGLEDRFLATTLLFGCLSIIFHMKKILDFALNFKYKILNKTFISKKKTNFSPNSSIPEINKNQITHIIYFLLIIVVSFVMIFFSSKFLIQLGDLIPYFILIYFFISLIQKFDSRIPIAFALLLLFLTAITLVQGQEKAANQIAIYAYYFLVIGVVQQLIEYIRNPQEA
jgi:hypothetical protein